MAKRADNKDWADKAALRVLPYISVLSDYEVRAIAAKLLRQERAAWKRAVKKAISLLDTDLGDTDPANEPDEAEDPVFHAHKILAARERKAR